MRPVNLPEDLEPANDAFFTHQLIELILKQAATHVTANWHDLTSLYDKLREVQNTLLVKGAKGYFWLVMPPEINEILEINHPKKYVTVPMDQLPLGYNCILYMGTLDKRWRMYADPLLKDTVVMGATFSKKNPNFYATLKLEGFGKSSVEIADELEKNKALMEGFYPN